jgi:type I restriction enzyme S subunit
MNAERLLAHYEQISEGPDGIARLRRFILNLAVRGKLVPQDPKDEPALQLLKRTEKEKARAIKKDAELSPVPGSTTNFPSPAGWVWTTLGTVANIVMGQSPPGDTYNKSGEGVPLINGPVEFSAGPFGITVVNQYTTAPTNFCEEGDLLICVRGSTTGRTNVAGFRACIGRGVAAIQPYFDGAFIRLFIWKSRDSIMGMGRGIAFPSVSRKQIEDLAFPLPPLAEQHRIVAKVDALMALCDRLEAARTAREATRDRLAAASLARLNALDPATFHADARFALDVLPAITARPDQIRQLRQTILNLAVRGKLVPQDPADEPASELLKRIAAENKKLIAAKGIRSQKPALPAENFEADTEIPSTWCHVYLQDIAYQITDGTHLTPKYTDAGKPFLSAQNVKPFRFMPDRHRFVSEVDFDNYRANRRPERGDILMTRVGAGIGEAAVLDSDFEFAFYVSLCLMKVPNQLVSVDYLVLWLNSPEGRESSTIRTYGKGASQGNLNLGLIRTFKIPLPPLAEQHRIVAKVDALMALCDRLKASLDLTAATRRRLLDALLAEALAPAEDRELEAAE